LILWKVSFSVKRVWLQRLFFVSDFVRSAVVVADRDWAMISSGSIASNRYFSGASRSDCSIGPGECSAADIASVWRRSPGAAEKVL
jgi:hypothetical protein